MSFQISVAYDRHCTRRDQRAAVSQMMVSDDRGPVDTTVLHETCNCNEEKTDHNRLAFSAPSEVVRDCRRDDSSKSVYELPFPLPLGGVMATLATLSSLYQTSASGCGFPACLHPSMLKNSAHSGERPSTA